MLISDLYEGGVREEMLRRVAAMTAAGVQVIALLALSDEGAPAYDHENAAALAALGVPAFACTPDVFPDLMAAAIERRDLPRGHREGQRLIGRLGAQVAAEVRDGEGDRAALAGVDQALLDQRVAGRGQAGRLAAQGRAISAVGTAASMSSRGRRQRRPSRACTRARPGWPARSGSRRSRPPARPRPPARRPARPRR